MTSPPRSRIDATRRSSSRSRRAARSSSHRRLIQGRYAIRLCVLNHTTEDEDVAFAIDRVAEADVSDLDLAAAVPTRPPVSGTTVDRPPSSPSGFGAADLRTRARLRSDHRRPGRSLPGRRPRGTLRGGHGGDRALGARAHVLRRARRRGLGHDRRDRGEPPVGGDSFGEIAAIDWGRDFSYGRTATVTATMPTRLLALPGAALRELMLDSPAVDAAIRQIAYDRMHRAIGAT